MGANRQVKGREEEN